MRQQSSRSLRFLLGAAVLCCGSCPVLAVTPMVSLGDSHALALRTDGTVLAWGSDAYGQLGLGRSLLSASPVRIFGLADVQSIAGGNGHSLAVRKDGTVWAWGENVFGQLGDASAVDRSSPVQVLGVTGATRVCAGGWHSVALRQDGTVWAWGNNWFGQLGNGSTAYTASPGPVVGLTGVTSIACFANQSIALLKDGTVRAWGANESGQVGDGTTTDRWLPTPVAGLTQITAISGTTALRQDGSVWEWGYVGWSGQKPHLVAVRSIGIADAIALGVSSGGVFGARVEAIRSDLQGWWEWTPGTTPTLQPDLGRISAVASAPYHTLVLRSDGTVLASGLNNSGQLGNGINPSGGWDWQADFLPVVGAVSMRQIAAGLSHSLALDASGNVWAWGDDEHGQLGRGVTLSRTVPTEVPGLRNIVQVSAGREGSSFAVDADGHLWVWGLNAHGRLGDGSGANRSRPFELPGFDNVRSVARGMTWSSVALKHDGTVWTWGNNFSGQLGSGTTEAYTTRPAIVPGLASVTDVAASGAHMLALKSDESVWSWGSNDNGQLGLGNTAASPAPVLVPTLSGVRSVVAGDGRSFALMADGTVMGWGSGRWGALGDGTWSEFNQPSPKVVPKVTQVVELASGTHTLALRSDGSLWGWGQTWGGSEMGPEPPGSTPGPIATLTPVQSVAASQGISALLGVYGFLYVGGANAQGQLGDGTFAQHPGFALAVAPGGTGFLNLGSTTNTKIPPALQTPFFISSTGGISDNSASVATATKFNPADTGKSGAVFITASVPTGSAMAQSAKGTNAKSGPHPNKAAGTTPPAFTLLQLTPSGWQTVTNGQLIPYASGLLGDQLAAQTILNGTDTSSLKGAEFCVGYGTSAADMLANGNIRAVATIPGATTSTSCVVGGTLNVALSVLPGWNLLSNPVNPSIAVATQFGDTVKVNSVWKWDSTAAKWQFYAPGMSAAELQSYATSQGYGVLNEIQAGDGFWVHAKVQADLGTVTGAAINLRQSSLSTGWNLVATAGNVTPQDFNLSLSTTPPTAGQVPINMTSLWAWDSAQSRWYFYAPSLDAQGGSALTNYLASQSYKDFGSNAKTLGNGVGFWVRRP